MYRDADHPAIALTAGHCLLTPPNGKPDKAVALRFVSQKGSGAMKSTALKAGLILLSANA
jgi:V8-like Glu-specific endopeptidase